MVDLTEELSSHQFVRAVLDEACDIEVTCSDTHRERNQHFKGQLWVTSRGHGHNAKTLLPLGPAFLVVVVGRFTFQYTYQQIGKNKKVKWKKKNMEDTLIEKQN